MNFKPDIFGESGLNVFVDALGGGNTGGKAIENQESRGQQQFVNSEYLPKNCNGCTWSLLEQMGIVLLEDTDDIFYKVALPKGWKKVATDHSMWSNLVDNKGRVRAHIFYKAAFYDRSAHISLERRYTYRMEPTAGRDIEDWYNSEQHCVVVDQGKIIWQSEEKLPPPPDRDDKQAFYEWREKDKAIEQSGRTWLNQHFPDWENPLAYWD
jgi:hypothetical protein